MRAYEGSPSFLRILEEESGLALPAINEKIGEALKGKKNQVPPADLSWIDTSELGGCEPTKLEIVRPGDGLCQWRA